MNEHSAALQSEYNLVVKNISQTEGGWSALAYKVESEQGVYFLKVYEKNKRCTALLLNKLSLSMAVSSWLDNNTELRGRIIAPLLTKNGNIKHETSDYVYLLFPYINGVTQRGNPLSVYQQEELAEIVGELHRHGADIPLDLSGSKETFEIPCNELLTIPYKSNDSLCLYKHRDMLMRIIERTQIFAEYIKSENPPFVLCHTDIHGWNLMQSDNLILIDWESIKFAPAEADLYAVWGDWYWGNLKWGSYWESFLPVYQKTRPEYEVREDFLRFYQIRRHIEDINEFYIQYLYDDMTEEETREVISEMERECNFLNTLTY